MTEANRQAREARRQPHPWGGKQQGSMAECVDLMATRDVSFMHRSTKSFLGYLIKHDPDGWNPRFDGSGRVVQHVKDGRPLTERGAELLKGGDANETKSDTGLGDTRGPHAAPARLKERNVNQQR